MNIQREGKRKIIIILILLFIPIISILIYNNVESTAIPLSLATLEAIDHGQIDYEVKFGKIFVSVIDKFGDSHIHQLFHKGISRKEALKVLAEKKAALESK